MSNKKSWPDLVGKSADEAVEEIKKENSGKKKHDNFY
jgi:hypothetical protein